jgi:hypothetical protein
MTYRRAYVPGIVAQARGLRGPKGDAGDITLISSVLSTYLSNYAATSHTHGSVLGYNITGTFASGGLTLSAAAPEAAANAVRTVAGGYISLDTFGAFTTVSVTGLQPAGAYLTTAANSTHTHSNYITTAANSTHIHGGLVTVATIGSNITHTSVSSGLTLAIPAYITTAPELWHSHTDVMSISERPNYFYTSNNTFANSTHIHGSVYTVSVSGSNITNSSASSGLTLGVPNYLMGTHTHGSVLGQNITAVSASSGLTLSVAAPIPLANSTRFLQAWELDTGGNTAGTLSSLQGSKIYFGGGSNITLSGDSNTIWIDAGGGLGNLSLGVLNDTYSSTNIVLYNGPQIAFSGHDNITIYTAESSDSIGTYFMFSAAAPGAATNSVHVVSDGWLATTVSNGATTLKVTGLDATAMHGSLSSLYIPQSSAANLFLDANSTLLQIAGAYLTTAANLAHTHGNFVTTATAGTAVVGSSSSNGFTLGVPAFVTVGGGGAQDWSCSTTLGSGITVVTGAATNTLSYGNFLTTAANSTHTHGSLPSITGGIGVSSNSSAWSISIPAYLTTAANSTHIHGTLYTTNINGTSASNALSLSVPAGSVYFSNVATNNITFGSVTSGSSTTITAIAGGGTGFAGTSFSTAGITGSRIAGAINTSGITLSVPNYLTTAIGGGVALGNTVTIPFTSGSVMLSGVNLTVNTSSAGASQYLQISAPAIGYLFFSNTNGHSWSSSVNGVSTSVYVIT